MRKLLLLFLFICGLVLHAQAQKNVELSSPNGEIKVSVRLTDKIYYDVACNDERIAREAVIGAGTVITASTKIIDVSQPEPVTYKGYVPPRSVVIPGSYPKKFAAGEYGVPCALIIGQRKESTDTKTSLNDALRDFDVPV